MATSLIKFFHKNESNDGKKLFWERADIDGFPFRGWHVPILNEEEYEQNVVRIADFKNGFFDVSNEEENKKFIEIMDACCNGWFKCVYIERFWNNTTKHYVEWVEFYMEDGTRTPFFDTKKVNNFVQYDGGHIGTDSSVSNNNNNGSGL